MRDGVKLATDVYFPVGVSRAPVVLTRTPYGKDGSEIRGAFWARRGYIRAIQDVRGRFSSQGEWEGLIHEPKDGYDTVEWLARQPWCDGKVGMIGGSYLGWVQWLAAIEHPPHLVTIVPNVSPPDPFHNLPYDHGALALIGTMPWFTVVEDNAPDPEQAMAGKNWNELLKLLPVIDLDKVVLGRESVTWRHWLSHPTADAYWRPVMFLDKLKDVRIPVFHQSGWFDGDGIGSKLNYLAMARYGHSMQKMTIGPWGHADAASRTFRDQDFGAGAAVDLQRDYLRWFDYWLKGVDNGILKEPLVSIFAMGSNRWLHGAKYPLPETRFEKLYLASGGKLTFTPPVGRQAEDRYVYDPGDPTPDADPELDRKDLLVYTTAPFDKPYTIAGPLSAVLHASTSARDTDWFVHLTDVDPNGEALAPWASNGGGLVRARYRNSMAKTELLEPGKIYEYTIDLWHTGITIAPGHRLRVVVSSAAFPSFSRNLNTGGNNETETRFVKASQAIYHDARRQSYIVLPRIPE
jgi:putative CocE/NonD family hydrolase